MIAHASPDEVLLGKLPLPLAQLYRRAHNAKTPLEQYLTAFYLWEAALKLLASVTVVEYAQHGPATPDIAERLKNLARPALGHWWELVRLLVPTLADAGDRQFVRLRDRLLGKPTSDCPRAAGLDAFLREVLENKSGARTTVQFTELFHRLVTLRNGEMGHGAAGQRPPAYYERSAPALLAGVGEALSHLDVLAGRSLVHVADVRRLATGDWLVERLSLSGGELRRLESLKVAEADAGRLPRPGRLYLHGPDDAAAWRSLHPLVLFDGDAEQVFFLNGRVRQRRAEYLCYTSGTVVKRDELGQDQRELLAKVLGGPVDDNAVEQWADRSTAGDPPAPAPTVPASRTLGEFELMSRLGRGGMGVVYRAWQPSLCRQVALKCLLRTDDPKAEARFAREIRALGRVEHPNLVKVFTSGSDGDQWFYAMELIEGADLGAVIDQLAGSTAADLADDSWTTALSSAWQRQKQKEQALGSRDDAPRSATAVPAAAVPFPVVQPRRDSAGHVAQVVEVIRQVAEAAHTLHEAGVVHRDIKPGNILLTSDGGHAVLMDLGLAQLTDETEGRLTRTRQFVGTLRYASPEQVLAAGHLDRRADVYSLGATLWELLTLRPLFGATEQTPTPDLMLTIQSKDPDRPRRLNRRVPRDLQAIVLKCLEKDRSRRYATAGELAAELGRWQRGEAVQAQPQSLRYLLGKAVRRHRAPLTLAAGALLLAVAGVVAAFLEINNALHDAKEANAKADKRRIEAVNALADLKKANEELKTSEFNLRGMLARSWLLPLAAQPGPLGDPEAEVLALVAAKRKEPLTIWFIEEALKEPRFTRRLRLRSEYMLHAAVGLDPEKRAEVEQLLVRHLHDPGVPEGSRQDAALALAGLGGAAPAAASEAVQTLTPVLRRNETPADRLAAAEGVSALAAHLDPREAAVLLARAMQDCVFRYQLEARVRDVVAAAARVAPREAGLLTRVMEDAGYPAELRVLAQGVAGLAARMEPRDAGRAVAGAAVSLTGAMGLSKNSNALLELATGLAALAARMEPPEAARPAATAANLIVGAMTETENPYRLRALGKGVAALAAHLQPREAARAAGGAAALLGQAMTNTTDPNEWEALAEGLAAMAAYMEPREATRTARGAAALLAQAMTGTADSGALRALAGGLSAVTVHMEPAAAAALLVKVMAGTGDASALRALVEGLAAVVVRMTPTEVARVAERAAAFLARATTSLWDVAAMGALAQDLAARVDLQQAAALFTKAVAEAEGPDTPRPPAERPSATAGHTEPSETTRAASFNYLARNLNDGALNDKDTKALVSSSVWQFSRLESAGLAELLTQPLCVGNTRRLVLDELGQRYQRRFADQWDFVRFAEEQKLGFDLAGPPKLRQSTEVTFP